MSIPPEPSPAAGTASEALLAQIDHVMRLHERREADPALAAALERLAAWQARRLRRTYADLEALPRYTEAVDFFETDLYGGDDFARRDADLARVVPVMVRMLPASVIASIAKAMEANALSQELDRALLAKLPRKDASAISVADYCRAYRSMKSRPARERQIGLIADIGRALDGFVRMPLIGAALVMMRQPARLAGMSALHDFLERGYAAFSRMGGADEFLATIVERETALMNAILRGDNAPFPEPLQGAADTGRDEDARKPAPVAPAR